MPHQLTIKYIWMRKLRALRPNLEFFADIYRNNSESSSKYYAVCCRFARRSRRIILYAFSFYMYLYVVATMTALYDLWRSNGTENLVHLYIPGYYVSSWYEVTLLTILNFMVVLLTFCCIPPVDLFFYLVFGNVPLVAAIVRSQMDEFSALFRSNRVEHDIIFVKRHFLAHIRIHHEYNQ